MTTHKYDDECDCNKCNNEWRKAFIRSLNRGQKSKV